MRQVIHLLGGMPVIGVHDDPTWAACPISLQSVRPVDPVQTPFHGRDPEHLQDFSIPRTKETQRCPSRLRCRTDQHSKAGRAEDRPANGGSSPDRLAKSGSSFGASVLSTLPEVGNDAQLRATSRVSAGAHEAYRGGKTAKPRAWRLL